MIRLLIERIKIPILGAALLKPKSLSKPPIKRSFSEIIKPVNERFIKDVIVYKYENPRKFRMLNLFAIAQFVFWCYMSHWSYSEMKDTKVLKYFSAGS